MIKVDENSCFIINFILIYLSINFQINTTGKILMKRLATFSRVYREITIYREKIVKICRATTGEKAVKRYHLKTW